MCDVWDPTCIVAEAAEKATDTVIGKMADAILQAQTTLIREAITGWVRIPTGDISTVALTLQGWMMPFTVMLTIGGILWQSLQIIISRKPGPFAAILKGLITTVLWAGVAVGGSNMLLGFADDYSVWILAKGLDINVVGRDDAGHLVFTQANGDILTTRMMALLVPSMAAPGLVLILETLVVIATIVQVALLIFRAPSIVILAGLLPLAASGSFSRATSGWLHKILSWQLSLIFYKPMAATVYAVAFKLIGSQSSTVTQWLGGAAMLVLSVITLPAMLKFFNWTTGAASSGGGGGIGMLGGAGAAGIHALASHTGSSGGARDYARYMENRGDGPAAGGGIARQPTPTPTPSSGGGLPSFTGLSGTAAASSTTAAAPAATGTAAAATGATGGVAAPLVVGVQVAQMATSTLKQTAAGSGAS